MTLGQALLYFCREAVISLVRSWKVSLLAIATIAISLFLAGIFAVVSGNLSNVVEGWRSESRIVVYLEAGAEDARVPELRTAIEAAWVTETRLVPASEARTRFADSFPGLADLLEGWEEDPLPTSIEVTGDWSQAPTATFDAWLDTLRGTAGVAMVDDDRDWLRQLEAAALALRGMGLVIGGVLLVTAVFTISSVIRLTVFLYQDEIGVMRLVGATEFFIRGPFYVEGFLQGLLGGGVAAAALAAARSAALHQAGDRLLTTMLAREGLGPWATVGLIVVGGLAGLIGAVVSLRKEKLAATATPSGQ